MDIAYASLEESFPVHRDPNTCTLSRPSTTRHGIRTPKAVRPKSVPVNISSSRKADLVCQLQTPTPSSHSQGYASSSRTECQRLTQLELCPERKKLNGTTFGLKKPVRPSWQAHMESEVLVPCLVGPGYVLSRNKSKIHVQLGEMNPQSPKERVIENLPKPVEMNSVERDNLIAMLQQQIDDLSLAVEEEKLNHKDSKRLAAELMKVKIDDLTKYYKKEIETIEEMHLKKLMAVREEHVAEMNDCQNRNDIDIKKQRREIEMLQAAFESYKLHLMDEMNEKLNRRLNEVRQELLEDAQEQLEELQTRMNSEKLAEKADIENAYQEKLSRMKRDHKQQFEDLRNRYSEKATDMEKLRQTEACLNETQQELDHLQDVYQNTCLQLDGCRLEGDQMKVKMMEWEEKFESRIKQIDETYREEIDEQKKQLSELRILYIKKCSELLDLKHSENVSLNERVMSAKETMKVIIETRLRSEVSLAPSTDPALEHLYRQPKTRPTSAPVTRFEVDCATVNAGLIAENTEPCAHYG